MGISRSTVPMMKPTIFLGGEVSATRKTLRRWVARSRSQESYIWGMLGRKEYLAGSQDSCSLQSFSTMGSTAGTSSGFAGLISKFASQNPAANGQTHDFIMKLRYTFNKLRNGLLLVRRLGTFNISGRCGVLSGFAWGLCQSQKKANDPRIAASSTFNGDRGRVCACDGDG